MFSTQEKGGQRIDYLNELINVAQNILDAGWDVEAFLIWETSAFLALLSLFGPFHYYTRNFKHLTSENNRLGLLAGAGLLIAASEETHKIIRRLHGDEEPIESSV